MRITALEPSTRHADWWHLSVDGEYICTLDADSVVAEGLSIGRDLTAEDVARLRTLAEERRAMDAALRYLTARPRSRAEVRRRLLRRTPTKAPPAAEVVDRVLARLERMHLLDDRAFADFWTEQRDRFSPRSAYAIAQELRQRGVERTTADAAIRADPDADLNRALDAGRQRLYSLRALDYPTFQQRLSGFLLRRGFRYGEIREAVRTLWRESHGDNAPLSDDDDGFALAADDE